MITALIIFFGFCVVMIIIKSTKPKQSQKPQDTHKVINLTVDLSKPAKSPEYYERRHKRLTIRGARLDRHRRIWSVLFLTNSFYELEQRMKSGYPTKRMLQNLESAKAAVLENNPTAEDINTAIKFCQIEFARGKCPHRLTADDIQAITNIKEIAILPPPITV